jgi:molybdopterin biosynthesis enzyme
MQGAGALLRPRVIGVAGEVLESDPSKEEFIRVRFVDDQPTLAVVKTGGQGSHVLSGAATADAFAVLERGVARIEANEPVVLELFRAQETRSVEDVG